MKLSLVALLIAGTACHPAGVSERIDLEPTGVQDSLAQASSKSLGGSHLYFNETFDDASEVAEAWRYECMRELEHSEDDLDTLIDNVNSLSPKENRKCGTGEDVSPLEAMLECCSPSSGVLDLESTEYEPGSGADDLEYSEDECLGFYRQGYCPTMSSGTQRFVTWPTDTRTWPNITKDIKNRKGGGEMAIKANNNPRPIVFNQAGDVETQGWDEDGTSYLNVGRTTFYGFRLRVNSAKLLTDQLADSAYLFQFHGRRVEDCEKLTDDDLSVAPLAALLLKQTDGELELQFKTKSPNRSYYQNVVEVDGEGAVSLDETGTSGMEEVRNTVFWRSPFGEQGDEAALSIGKWMTVVVEVKEAGQRESLVECETAATEQTGKSMAQLLLEYCDPDDSEAQDELLEVYEACRPSDGYLALYINGRKMVGNNKKANVCDSLNLDEHGVPIDLDGTEHPRTLAWTYGQSQFNGVTTRYRSCPNYLKIGHYALGYKYKKIQRASVDWTSNSLVPTLDTEFDFVRIANTHALVDNTVLTELIKEEK